MCVFKTKKTCRVVEDPNRQRPALAAFEQKHVSMVLYFRNPLFCLIHGVCRRYEHYFICYRNCCDPVGWICWVVSYL